MAVSFIGEGNTVTENLIT